jgi:outer membrane protein
MFRVRIKKLHYFVSALLITSASTVHAEDLLDIYELASKNDPVFTSGIYQYTASKEIYEQARALLLPNIKFDIGTTETSQDIVSSDNAVFSQGSTSFPTDEMNLSITQSIYSFSNWAYFKQAKEEVKQVAAELEDVRQELVLRVAEAYFGVLREHDNYLAIGAEFTALEQHNQVVTAKEKSGNARHTDLLDSEARLSQSEARMIETNNALQDAIQGLREMTGELPETLVLLGDELDLVSPEPYDVQSWLDKAHATNPMIVAKKSEVAVAYQEIRRQKGGHYPNIDLVFTQNNSETQGSLFGGGSEVDTQEVQLKMTVPLYSGGAVSSKVRETVNLHFKAKDDLEQLSRETARETRAAYRGVTASISTVRALEKSVSAFTIAVDAKRAAFQSGLIASESVLDAERDLFIARSQFSASRYDYILNHLRLKRAAGILSEADLQAMNERIDGDTISTQLEVM